MTVDKQAKALLMGESCLTCSNMVEINGKPHCDQINMHSTNYVDPIEITNTFDMCPNWEKGWNQEFMDQMEQAVTNGSTSSMTIFGPDGKPTLIDLTNTKTVSV